MQMNTRDRHKSQRYVSEKRGGVGEYAGIANYKGLSLKLWGKGPNILGLFHQTTGTSPFCTAVWMTDRAQ